MFVFLDYNSDTDISLNETNSSQGHPSICKKLLSCRMWTNFLKLRGDLVELQKNMAIASPWESYPYKHITSVPC